MWGKMNTNTGFLQNKPEIKHFVLFKMERSNLSWLRHVLRVLYIMNTYSITL